MSEVMEMMNPFWYMNMEQINVLLRFSIPWKWIMTNLMLGVFIPFNLLWLMDVIMLIWEIRLVSAEYLTCRKKKQHSFFHLSILMKLKLIISFPKQSISTAFLEWRMLRLAFCLPLKRIRLSLYYADPMCSFSILQRNMFDW